MVHTHQTLSVGLMLCVTGAIEDGGVDDELLESAMMSAAGSCLVCLSTIRRGDAVRENYCTIYL